MTPEFGLLRAAHFVTFLQDDRFRSAVRSHRNLGPIAEAADVVERSAELSRHLEAHWDEVRHEVDILLRRWCDDLAVSTALRPPDLADRLLFALDGEAYVPRTDYATLHDIVSHDYATIGGCGAEVAGEIRRIVPRDVWASAYLVLSPDDPPGADSTSEASLLIGLCMRTGIWRLYRLLVDPNGVPPRGFGASDAIRFALDLPARSRR